ncbi:cytochrome b5 [Trametopsis cervina]|nr:cytochrome b5 [Trametopsis cervina]
MSWLLNPEGDNGGRRIRQRPNKLTDLPTAFPGNEGPRTPGRGPKTPGSAASVPGSPWAEFPMKDNYPKVPDPTQDDREVSTKQANRPFLGYAKYREDREKAHEDWLARKEERELKLARGEDVGPEERDPTAEPEVGFMGLLQFIVVVLAIVVLAGKFFTGSYMWEQDFSKTIVSWIPTTDQRMFSDRTLAAYTGEREGQPIYVAIDGDVYDVSTNPQSYGPGGSYHFMAGRDAARAFATGCFATHRTYDIRDLTDREMKSLEHWKNFFATSKKYKKVGRVLHEPIDIFSPVPEPCDPKRQKTEGTKAPEGRTHDEL